MNFIYIFFKYINCRIFGLIRSYLPMSAQRRSRKVGTWVTSSANHATRSWVGGATSFWAVLPFVALALIGSLQRARPVPLVDWSSSTMKGTSCAALTSGIPMNLVSSALSAIGGCYF